MITIVGGLIVFYVGNYLLCEIRYKAELNLLEQRIDSAEIAAQSGLENDALVICAKVNVELDMDREPELYAKLKYIEGNSYLGLAMAGEEEHNFRKAIAAFREGLKAIGERKKSVFYILNCANLGTAYGNLAEIRASHEYLDSSQILYNDALESIGETRFTGLSTLTIGNMGIVYSMLAENCVQPNKKKELLNKSIGNFNYVIGRKCDVIKNKLCAGFYMNLGTAYADLAVLENKIDNLYNALTAFERALGYYRPENYPFEYAGASNNMALALRALGNATDSAVYFENAISILEELLDIYTLERYPRRYASTHHNLGNAYTAIGESAFGKRRIVYYEKAAQSYEEALRFRNITGYPLEYAETAKSAAAVYYVLSQFKNRENNLKRAMEYSNGALRIFTFNNYPLSFAAVHFVLGNCYRNITPSGQRELNLLSSAEHFRQSLAIYTIGNYPDDFAKCNYLLSNVLLELFDISGNKEYLAEAVYSCQQALLIYTKDRYPDFNKKLSERCLRANQALDG